MLYSVVLGNACLNLVQGGDFSWCSEKLLSIYISISFCIYIYLYLIPATKCSLPCLSEFYALVILVSSDAVNMDLEPGFVGWDPSLSLICYATFISLSLHL